MSEEFERIWKETIMAESRHYPGICLEGQRKAKRNLRHDSQYFD
jgi:hypothetical protein